MSVITAFDEFSSARPGQDVSFTASSAAFTLAAGRWRFIATQNCWVRRVASGDATAASTNGSTYWPSGTIWYEEVTADDVANSVNRFAVIRDSADGTLRVNSASR